MKSAAIAARIERDHNWELKKVMRYSDGKWKAANELVVVCSCCNLNYIKALDDAGYYDAMWDELDRL